MRHESRHEGDRNRGYRSACRGAGEHDGDGQDSSGDVIGPASIEVPNHRLGTVLRPGMSAAGIRRPRLKAVPFGEEAEMKLRARLEHLERFFGTGTSRDPDKLPIVVYRRVISGTSSQAELVRWEPLLRVMIADACAVEEDANLRERGRAIRYAQALEVCKYGRQPAQDELKPMFPF
jgi:hypothetical protein